FPDGVLGVAELLDQPGGLLVLGRPGVARLRVRRSEHRRQKQQQSCAHGLILKRLDAVWTSRRPPNHYFANPGSTITPFISFSEHTSIFLRSMTRVVLAAPIK